MIKENNQLSITNNSTNTHIEKKTNFYSYKKYMILALFK